MSFPPDAFLIGAMKAGTTSLAGMLAQHPDICLSNPKEPHFLTANSGKGLDWYRSCFSDPDKFCLDASTSYSIAPVPGPVTFKHEVDKYRDVQERLHQINPDARLIYMLREPVSRAYSHYNHNVRVGWEKRPFLAAVKEDSQYLSASDYVAQLDLYLQLFSRDKVLLLIFEDFKANPLEANRKVLRFLGLDDAIELNLDKPKNAGFLYNGIGARVNQLGIMKPLSKIIPSSIKRWLGPMVSKKIPPISQTDRAWLSAYFEPRNVLLAQKTNLDLSIWRLADFSGNRPRISAPS